MVWSSKKEEMNEEPFPVHAAPKEYNKKYN